jgi:CRP-like cAMP-binding protein
MSQSVPDMILRGVGSPAPGRSPEQGIRRSHRQTAQALSAVPFFATLSKKELRRLAEDTDVVSFAAGQTIVEEGMPGETMYVVLAGEAKVQQGRRRLGTVRPGDFFGEVAVLDGAARSATVTAQTPLTAVRLYRRTLLRLFKAEPNITLKVLDGVVRRIRELTRALDA